MKELYEYVGEAYGVDSGDMSTGTLEAWRRAFTAICAVNMWRYRGLITRDGGETYQDPETGETLLERILVTER